MPSWVKDHGKWSDAKADVGDKYGDDDKKWAAVTTVYKNMGGKIDRAAKRDVAREKKRGK
jgi:hypothetical protein